MTQKKRTFSTPEQRQESVQKVKDAMAADPKLSVAAACKQTNVSYHNFMNWNGKSSSKKKKKTKKNVLVQALVPIAPDSESAGPQLNFNGHAGNGNGRKPDTRTLLRMAAEMNMQSLLTLVGATQ